MTEKEIYIQKTFTKIRAKKLKEPIKVNAAVIIPDLEMYLETVRKAMMNYENKKILRHFVTELEILLKL